MTFKNPQKEFADKIEPNEKVKYYETVVSRLIKLPKGNTDVSHLKEDSEVRAIIQEFIDKGFPKVYKFKLELTKDFIIKT